MMIIGIFCLFCFLYVLFALIGLEVSVYDFNWIQNAALLGTVVNLNLHEVHFFE